MWKALSETTIKHCRTGIVFISNDNYWMVDDESLLQLQSDCSPLANERTLRVLELECTLWAYGRELFVEKESAYA
ncbi:hypothetical protein ECAE60S_04572 [Eoetvoesiella caeni]